MNRSGAFCPRCGNELGEDEGLVSPDPGASRQARLCSACFREELDLVSLPDEVTIRLCTGCGAIVRDGNWVDVGDVDATDVAIETVGEALAVHREATDVQWGVEPIQRGPNELDVRVTVSALVDGEPVTREETVLVRIARETCQRCGRIAGDSYAGTVQVRADDRTPTPEETDRAVEIGHAVVDDMRKSGDRDAFIAEVIERPEGVDIRVSTTKIGAKIATNVTAELGGTYETSETLVTEDEDGQGVYRVAYAVRLPRIRPGDIVELPSGPMLVERATAQFEGRNLATGEAERVDPETIAEATHLGSAEDARETTVVSVVDEHSVQVLDPETFDTVTIRRPPDVSDDAESVRVFKHDGSVYALPRSGEAA